MSFTTSSSQTYLAFDYGELRIGVAVGQAITGTATPIATLKTNGSVPDWNTIKSLLDEWEPSALIVGLPPTINSDSRRLVRKITKFCHALQIRFALPVHTIDESFTSTEAYHQLRAQRRLGRKRTLMKEDIDRAAAAIILESWMANHKPDIPVSR